MKRIYLTMISPYEPALEALRKKGYDMSTIPDILKKEVFFYEDLIEELVQKRICDEPLKLVPIELRTREMCLRAITDYTHTLRHVPLELRTEEMCLEAIWENDFVGVPDKLLTPEFCLKAVCQNGHFLSVVPKELITPELCLEAIKNSKGEALEYVPDELKTEEMCAIAIQDGENFDYVPDRLLTKRIIKSFVSNYWYSMD